MAYYPWKDTTITINGKSYTGCDMTVELETDWRVMPHGCRISPDKLFIKAEHPDEQFLDPLVVNYRDSMPYRHRLLEQQGEILVKRIQTHFPKCNAMLRETYQYDEKSSLSAAQQVVIELLWLGGQSAELGPLYTLMWMNDEELRKECQQHIDLFRKQEVEEEAHAERQKNDPLLLWRERLDRLGHGNYWRLVPSTSTTKVEGMIASSTGTVWCPEMSLTSSDTLVYIRDQKLKAYEQYVLIGTFADLYPLDDEHLQQEINTKFVRARLKFGVL